MRDLHQKRASLDYPIGGAGAVIDALIRGIEDEIIPENNNLSSNNQESDQIIPEKPKGKVLLNTHVTKILVESNQAIGVQIRNKNKVSLYIIEIPLLYNINIYK